MYYIHILLTLAYLSLTRAKLWFDEVDVTTIPIENNQSDWRSMSVRPDSRDAVVINMDRKLLYEWQVTPPYRSIRILVNLTGPGTNQKLFKVEAFNKTNWLFTTNTCMAFSKISQNSIYQQNVNVPTFSLLGGCSDLPFTQHVGYNSLEDSLASAPTGEDRSVFLDFSADPNSHLIFFMLAHRDELYQVLNNEVRTIGRSLPSIHRIEFASDQGRPYLLTTNNKLLHVTTSNTEEIYRSNASLAVLDIQYYEDNVWLLKTTAYVEENKVWYAQLDLKEFEPEIYPFHRRSNKIVQGRSWDKRETEMVLVRKPDAVILPKSLPAQRFFAYTFRLIKYEDLVTNLEFEEDQFLKFNYIEDLYAVKSVTLTCVPACLPSIKALAKTNFKGLSFYVYEEEVVGEAFFEQQLSVARLNVIKFSVPDQITSNVSMAIELNDSNVIRTPHISITPRARITFAWQNPRQDHVTVRILDSKTLYMDLWVNEFRSTPPTAVNITKIGRKNINIGSGNILNARTFTWQLSDVRGSPNYYEFNLSKPLPRLTLAFIDGGNKVQYIHVTIPKVEGRTRTEDSTSQKGQTTQSKNQDSNAGISILKVLVVTMGGLIVGLSVGVILMTIFVYMSNRGDQKLGKKIVKRPKAIKSMTVFTLADAGAVDVPNADYLYYNNVGAKENNEIGNWPPTYIQGQTNVGPITESSPQPSVDGQQYTKLTSIKTTVKNKSKRHQKGRTNTGSQSFHSKRVKKRPKSRITSDDDDYQTILPQKSRMTEVARLYTLVDPTIYDLKSLQQSSVETDEKQE